MYIKSCMGCKSSREVDIPESIENVPEVVDEKLSDIPEAEPFDKSLLDEARRDLQESELRLVELEKEINDEKIQILLNENELSEVNKFIEHVNSESSEEEETEKSKKTDSSEYETDSEEYEEDWILCLF